MLEPNTSPSSITWNRLYELGERLLKQPDTLHQCETIITHLRRRLAAEAKVWLAGPFYPLPGEAPVPLIENSGCPEIVKRAFLDKQSFCGTGDTIVPLTDDCTSPSSCWVIPMVTQDAILGILQVRFSEKHKAKPNTLNYLQALAAFAALTFQVTRQSTLKNWRFEQLSLVSSVSSQIANVQNLDDLCPQVTKLIQDTFHYYFVAIFTIEPGSNHLRFRASTGMKKDFSKLRHSIRLGQGIVGYVAESGVEFLAQDVRQEKQYRTHHSLTETRSEIALPLRVENRILGVLDVQSDRLNAFHEIDLVVLRSLADNVALAIEGARLYSGLQNKAEQISAVFDVSRALTSILELDTLLDQVVVLIQKHFKFPYVHIFSVHTGRRKIFYQAGSGARSSAMENSDLSYDLDDTCGLIPWAVQEGRTIVANDVRKEPRYRVTDLPPVNTRSEMVIPLTYAGEVLAVLDIQSDKLNAFDEDDQSVIEALAGSIAIAIRNANLYRTEQWRREVADSFRDVASLISSNILLDQLLDTILNRLENSLPCEAAAIWLLENDPASTNVQFGMRLAAVHGLTEEAIQLSLNTNENARNWLQKAAHAEKPNIREPADPFGPIGNALQLSPNYSSIAAPLRAGQDTLGVLALAHPSPGRYGSEAALITATFASYAAVAIQNARFYNQATDQAWISTVLLQVASASQAATSPDELFNTINRLTPLLVGVKKCAAFLYDETSNSYVAKSWYGIEFPEEGFTVAEKKSLAFLEMRARMEPIFLQDLHIEMGLPYEASHPQETKVLLPFAAHGNILGAFLVIHEPSGQKLAEQGFTEEKFAILQGISRQTATILENLLLIEARNQESYVTEVLLQVAQAVVSQNDLMDILETIIQLMLILVGTDISVIYLWDEDTYTYNPVKAAAIKSDLVNKLIGRTFSAGENHLLDQVRLQDQPVFCTISDSDADLESWQEFACHLIGEQEEGQTLQNQPYFLGFPLSIKGEFFGVLLAKEHQSSPTIREKRLEIINGIAQQISLAIQNEHFNWERVNQERINGEMQLARRMQENFLPEVIPSMPGWSLGIRWNTAREVGGDFYDIFELPDDRIALVIADVSDKGMPAAMYMTVARTLIRSYTTVDSTPAQILQKANNQLTSDRKTAMFVTAVVAILDPKTGSLICANAGHNPPMVIRAAKGKVDRIPHGGIALGVTDDCQLKDYCTILAPGDSLLLYTDGLTDASNSNAEAFGEQRLISLLKKVNKTPAEELLEKVDLTVRQFIQDEPAADDLTMLAVARDS
ncbi:MAG TPA: GAF domain-containing protein [Anaerolineaceae bacterium]|nr:GAF domain-containing protein [Anaerolineaceae bacterium]